MAASKNPQRSKTPSHRRPELRRRFFGGTLEDPVTTTVIFRVKAKGTPLSFWKTLFEVFIDDWSPKLHYDQRRAFFSLFLQLFAQWPIRQSSIWPANPELTQFPPRFGNFTVLVLRSRFSCGVEFRFRDNVA
jgi:hypothetical protein